MELKGKKINFLGDSITFGSGTSGEEKRFSNLIEAWTGAVCRNYGIGGTRIALQRKPSNDPAYDQDFCSRVDKMDADADVVVVFGGTNDFGHGDAPFGRMEDRTNATFCGALHTLYTRLINRYPEALIVVLTPLHRADEDSMRGSQKTEDVAVLKSYIQAIRETAEYYGLPVLDLYACSGLQPAVPVIRERYLPDGLHPNDAGHQILAHKIVEFLKVQ